MSSLIRAWTTGELNGMTNFNISSKKSIIEFLDLYTNVFIFISKKIQIEIQLSNSCAA